MKSSDQYTIANSVRESYSRAIHTYPRYVTAGSVRGYGLVHDTLDAAISDLQADKINCVNQGGYSDRRVYGVDVDGYLRDLETGDNIYFRSMTQGAEHL